MNRLVQDNRDLKIEVEKVQKYQVAYRSLMDDYHKAGLLPAYDAGFIHLDKQFLTIGINGMVEAAESQGIQPGNNKKYKNWVKTQLRTIYNANKRAKNKYGYMFNTEFVPAENLGAKNAAWDKKGGYDVITSYSIHYTKLYEPFLSHAAFFAPRFSAGTNSVLNI